MADKTLGQIAFEAHRDYLDGNRPWSDVREPEREVWETTAKAVAEDARERLEAAERVCLLVGWTAPRRENEPEKALRLLWGRWHRDYGHEIDGGPETAPLGLSEDEITDLARQQDETDRLERMRYMKPQEGTPDA